MRHILLAIVAIMVAATCQARTITVDDNSPADFINIQSAINQANDGDTIIIQPGRYSGNGNRDISFFGKAITVQSIDPYDANVVSSTTILCGGSESQPHRGFIFDSNEGPNSVLTGLTIRGGWTPVTQEITGSFTMDVSEGGGIYCKNSSPVITHCNIIKNIAYPVNLQQPPFPIPIPVPSFPMDIAAGGGIYFSGGNPTIAYCIISENSAGKKPPSGYPSGLGNEMTGYGGGIYGSGEANIVDCVFTKNGASTYGGAIYCSHSSVINCTIINNASVEIGGGIYCSDSTILNCIISYNSAISALGQTIPANETYKTSVSTAGGGISCMGNSLINNCLVRDNLARGSQAILNSSQRTGPGGNGVGGGIFVGRSSDSSVITEISNCIISGNVTIGGHGWAPPNSSWPQLVTSGGNGLGGGIYFDPCSTAVIKNCVIAANTCTSGLGGNIGNTNYAPNGKSLGGGVYCGNGVINGCTFFENKAFDAVGIYGSSTVSNCILWDKVGLDYWPSEDEISDGILAKYSNIKNSFLGMWKIEGDICEDPCFVKLGYWADRNDPNYVPPPPLDANIMPTIYPRVHSGLTWVQGDYHLQLESLCIDAGDPNYTAGPDETDLDGNRRVAAGRIDMGAFEFPNALPVADAGPNQVAYAWIDGIAEVILNGSGSYDADGDELSYLWTSSINENPWESNIVAPAIELPVGKYTFELVVNDGTEDSEPNYVDINVVKAVKGLLSISPQVINRQCEQKRIIAMLHLPGSITKDQIDGSQKISLYPGGIEAVNQYVLPNYTNRSKSCFIFAFFDRDDVLESIGGNGFVKVYAVGQLKTGQNFYGSSTIIITDHGRRPKWGNMRDWFRNYHRSHLCRPNKK
jgi:predicted outer membrane repeat protein